MHFYKPEITFVTDHPICDDIAKDYKGVYTQCDLIEFIFEKLQQVFDSEDKQEQIILESIAFPLYSIVTNKSYQSKITI